MKIKNNKYILLCNIFKSICEVYDRWQSVMVERLQARLRAVEARGWQDRLA